jgi:uncharacterized membrane protein
MLCINFVNRKSARRKVYLKFLAKNLSVCSRQTVQAVLRSLRKAEQLIVAHEVDCLSNIKLKPQEVLAISKRKLLYKVATWRFISICTMVITMIAITGSLAHSISMTVIIQIIQTIVHIIFESFWDKDNTEANN